MAICVFTTYIIIVILPVLCPSIVRRIYINTVNFALVWKQQELECMKVFTIDDSMIRTISAAPLNTTSLIQPTINSLVESRYGDKVVNGCIRHRIIIGTEQSCHITVDANDRPCDVSLVVTRHIFHDTARRQHVNEVAFDYGLAVQTNVLRF